MTLLRHSKRFELPMAFDVFASDPVIFKIRATINYIEDVCLNPCYAKELYAAIKESIVTLKTKEGFHIRDQNASELIGQDIYRIKLGKYKLLYEIDREKSIITIFTFLHESQDLESILLSDYPNES